jgi:cation transport ATPase
MQYHVIHHISGRLRLRLPELSAADDLTRLQTELEAIARFKSFRFNPTVRSAVIEYVTDPRQAVADHLDELDELFLENLTARIAIVTVFDRGTAQGLSATRSTNPAQAQTAQTQSDQNVNKQTHSQTHLQGTDDDWEQLTAPIASLGLASLATLIELPIVLVAGAIGLAAWPIIQRGLAGLTAEEQRDRHLKVELLDTLWMAWQLAQGQWIAPALLATLTETGIIVRDRTRQAERDELSSLLDHQTRGQTWVERDDQIVAIDVAGLQIGDVVIVGPDERVPIDGDIVAIAPQTQIVAPLWCEPRCDQGCGIVAIGQRLEAGTLVTRGELRLRAQRSGRATHAAIVQHLANTATTTRTDLGDRLDAFSGAIVAPTLIGAGSLFALGFPLRAIPLLQLDFGTGLAVTLPTTALSATIGAARQGIYVRDGRVLERLTGVKLAIFELSSLVIPMTVTEVYPLKVETPPSLLVSFATSAYHDRRFALSEVLERYAEASHAAQLACDRHHVIPGGGIEADILGQAIVMGSEAWLVRRGLDFGPFRRRYPELFRPPVNPNHEIHREFERLLFVVCEGELLGAVGYGVQICPTAEEAIATLQAEGITTYLISDDRAPVIDAIAQQLAIPVEHVIAAATPDDRRAVFNLLGDHQNLPELLWISRDREFEIPMDRLGLLAEIGTTLDVSLADPRIDLVAIDGDLRDIPHAIAIAHQATTMATLNAATVMLPNMSIVLTGMLFGFDPVLAVIINQCATLLAEFNGLQLRRGRSKSHHWRKGDLKAPDDDRTLSDRDLESLFGDPSQAIATPNDPSTSSSTPSDLPQNPQNLAIS